MVQPGDADSLADLELCHLGTACDDAADDLMSRDQLRLGAGLEAGRVAVDDVQIGVAHTAGFDFQQHLVGQWHGRGQIEQGQGLAVGLEDGSFHA